MAGVYTCVYLDLEFYQIIFRSNLFLRLRRIDEYSFFDVEIRYATTYNNDYLNKILFYGPLWSILATMKSL